MLKISPRYASFCLSFENDWSVVTQWGEGTHSDNYDQMDRFEATSNQLNSLSLTQVEAAEVSVKDSAGKITVYPRQSAEQVAVILANASTGCLTEGGVDGGI
jgi:hypothetical protein